MAAGGGGSWKVAYADFVTAMMAFFMVMWLTSQDQKIKEAIAKSFSSPYKVFEDNSTGMIPNESLIEAKGDGDFSSPAAVELLMLRKMAEDLLKTLEMDPSINADKDTFELTLTTDGVRLTLFNKSKNPIFKSNTSNFTDYGDWAVGNLAYAIDRFDNFGIEIDGHTRKVDPDSAGGDSWKLSIDRATVTRSKLISEGVPTKNVIKLAGFGDSKPRDNEPAESELNDRIDFWLRVQN